MMEVTKSDAYHYPHHTYDPNLGSAAAQYSPPYNNETNARAITQVQQSSALQQQLQPVGDQSQEPQHQLQSQEFSNVQYNTLVLGSTFNDNESALLDPTQGQFTLATDPRYNNQFVRTDQVQPNFHQQISTEMNISYQVAENYSSEGDQQTQQIMELHQNENGQFFQRTMYANSDSNGLSPLAEQESYQNASEYQDESVNIKNEIYNVNVNDEYELKYNINGYNPSDHIVEPSINLQLDEREQRLLLEASMSPLLAAVNDITSRDEHFQNYYTQDPAISSNQSDTFMVQNKDGHGGVDERQQNLKNTGGSIVPDEFVDINELALADDDSDEECGEYNKDTRTGRANSKKEGLLVADKPVPSRAWASLPSNYLSFENYLNRPNDFTIFSKRNIPLRSKFGPFEGDVRCIGGDDFDILISPSVHSEYPLLFLDQRVILDTSNELTSNWMRFVRRAQKFCEQNLLLFETGGKLFFKSCTFISKRQELRVGYSREYAKKYGLPVLFANDEDRRLLKERNHTELKNKNGFCQKRCNLISKSTHKIDSNEDNDDSNQSSSVENKDITNSAKVYLKSKHDRGSKCHICMKVFANDSRLEVHYRVHNDNVLKPLECKECHKRFMNASALAVHMKIHSETTNRYNIYCPFCLKSFTGVQSIREHAKEHMVNGYFHCQYCDKKCAEYKSIRKHIRVYHSSVKHACPECKKQFHSLYKLREHWLTHMNVRFACTKCNEQFKRKEKLQAHIKKMHIESEKEMNNNGKEMDENEVEIVLENDTIEQDNDEITSENDSNIQAHRFSPEIPASDYQKFTFKCHDCQLGFKRRGMLVNHLAKRHPSVQIDTVPELSAPILKTQRDYYCQYCEKVYKSSSKRKAHILKNHPGKELPQSTRMRSTEIPGQPNPSFTETVGNVPAQVQKCGWCHKQYASKARLLQHQRKVHADRLEENERQMRLIEKQFLQQHGQRNLRVCDFEDNKLLRLSSAALELEDSAFFTQNDSLSKVVDDFGETSSGSNGDNLAVLPILFEEIDYMQLKSVSLTGDDSVGEGKKSFEFSASATNG